MLHSSWFNHWGAIKQAASSKQRKSFSTHCISWCEERITLDSVQCITTGGVNGSEIAKHCKMWDIIIFQSDPESLSRLSTVLSLFKTRQYGILRTSERLAKTFLSPHIQYSPRSPHSHSHRLSYESFLWCQPALRLVAYGICGPSSQLGSPIELHLTSMVCTSRTLIEAPPEMAKVHTSFT